MENLDFGGVGYEQMPLSLCPEIKEMWVDSETSEVTLVMEFSESGTPLGGILKGKLYFNSTKEMEQFNKKIARSRIERLSFLVESMKQSG
jgi:hypothetical protein